MFTGSANPVELFRTYVTRTTRAHARHTSLNAARRHDHAQAEEVTARGGETGEEVGGVVFNAQV